MRRSIGVLFIATLLAGCGGDVAPEQSAEAPEPAGSHEVHWDYLENGPDRWGSLKDKWALCDTGLSQSPIDFVPTAMGPGIEVEGGRPASRVLISHHKDVGRVIDNGHTIQVTPEQGGRVEVDGVAYSLAQFHFHAPSEHTVEGRHFPVEVHFVHVNEAGELAVAGAFFEEGEHNEAFAPIFADLPTGEGEVRDLEGLELDLDSLVPVGSPYYRYLGSLTTPPCSEGVEWFVRTEPLSLSAGQIAEFKAIFDGNRRPTQPLNGRNVTQEEAAYVDQAAEAGS